MDNRALEGAVSILVMFIVPILVLNAFVHDFYTQNITFVLIVLIIVVGLINGYIFREAVKNAILYLVGIGEIFIIGVFILFYVDLQQQASNADPGLQSLGLIFVLIIFFVIFIAGAIGFLVFGVLIYIPSLIGKKMAERN